MEKIVKEIYLDNLPRYRGKNISWEKSIGMYIPFVYNDIKGELKIIKYNKEDHRLTIKYLDQEFEIATQSLQSCSLGEFLKIKTVTYKYSINEVVNNMQVLEKIRLEHGIDRYGKPRTEKAYEYKCLKCNYIGKMYEYQFAKGVSCQACCNRKIEKGINDISTTHPHLVKYFVNIEDTYQYSKSANKKVALKCPLCGFIKDITINYFYEKGFACNKCGDGVSYPEKIMHSVLEQLGIEFIARKKFKWSLNRAYDFYIANTNNIIETHGKQHYEEGFIRIKSNKKVRCLMEEQQNDRLKEQLAKENGISNYIVIDCRHSELEWIKNSILNSKLVKLFDLSNIDWLKCEEFALSSLVKDACNLWNNGIKRTKVISENLNVCQATIINYLKKGAKLGWCDYSIKESNKYRNQRISKANSKKVLCIENNMIFNSLKELEKMSEQIFGFKMQHSYVSHVCNGKKNKYKGYTFKYVS